MLDNTKESIPFIHHSCWYCHCQDSWLSHQHHLPLQNQATPREVWLQEIHGLNLYSIALGSLSSLARLMLVTPDFRLCLESPAEHPLGFLNGPKLDVVELGSPDGSACAT
jgi:hypothetical protein